MCPIISGDGSFAHPFGIRDEFGAAYLRQTTQGYNGEIESIQKLREMSERVNTDDDLRESYRKAIDNLEFQSRAARPWYLLRLAVGELNDCQRAKIDIESGKYSAPGQESLLRGLRQKANPVRTKNIIENKLSSVAAAYQEYLEFASQHPDIAAKHIGSNHPKCKPPQLYEELEQWVVVNKR